MTRTRPRGTQAQRRAQMTTMRVQREASALATLPPSATAVGAAFQAVAAQLAALAPSVRRALATWPTFTRQA